VLEDLVRLRDARRDIEELPVLMKLTSAINASITSVKPTPSFTLREMERRSALVWVSGMNAARIMRQNTGGSIRPASPL
jgi:hypothetical protein